MPVQPGTHLGLCEILSAIGAGGMGEFYRARDLKLGCDVAIKVVPEAFADDLERMARFQREAKFLARVIWRRSRENSTRKDASSVEVHRSQTH